MTKAVGNLEEAERLIKRAIQLRPMNTRFRVELAGILRFACRGVKKRHRPKWKNPGRFRLTGPNNLGLTEHLAVKSRTLIPL
jgi:hypothetical protein